MLSEPMIVIVALVVIMLFFWRFSDKIYESHHSTKKNHPLLFKLTGFNEKHLDDREKWIRHFRIQLILISILFLCALWVLIHGL